MAFRVVNGLRSIEFGSPGESRSNLISMVLDGNKRATAGTLEWDYQAENEAIETIGEELAILDNDGSHVGTIRATRVEVVRFADVPDEFALAEAEGDQSGDDFRESHSKFWSALGLNINANTKIVLLYFDLVADLRN